MLSNALLAGLSAGTLAHAALLPRTSSESCKIELSVSGSITGGVGQLSSGQARVGAGISTSTFTYSNGALVDASGRGCWWTPPTMTLQCDEGQTPSTGFEIGSGGSVSYNGQTTFYECFGGVDGQYNLYLGPNAFECDKVTITADNYGDCSGSSGGSSPPKSPGHAAPPAQPKPKPSGNASPPPTKPMAPPATKPGSSSGSSSGKSCSADLSGDYEFPHLIIPIDSSQPSNAPGSSYFGEVSSTISTLFDFDIPSSDSGKTCSLVFLFPTQAELETSSFTFSGSGGVSFSKLASPAVEGKTSYNSCPAKSESYGSVTVAPGNSYVVATFACPAGERVGFEMMAEGSTSLRYFQDYNPSPIGLYITVC